MGSPHYLWLRERSSLVVESAPAPGRESIGRAEDAREVALVRESIVEGDLAERR